jgi:cell division protein FtsN
VKKQKSSGGRNVLIILNGLVFVALLVVGVTWFIWVQKTDTSVAQGVAAQRMKVPPIPEAQRMKIPPAPSPPQEVIEPAAMPAPRHEEETFDAVDLDKALPSDTTAGDTPAPEMTEVAQSVQESSQTTHLGAPSKKTPQPPAATATRTERFNLQVGAFRVEQYAREKVAKLSKKGYAPFIVEITDARRRTWYTVRIGRYENRENAAASLQSFIRNENITAVIAKARIL